MRALLEQELERKLVWEVRSRHGLCMKWVCPGNRGVPDRIVLMPGGRVYFIEMKRPGKSKTDPLQEYWARTLRQMGFETRLVHSLEELGEALRMIDGGEDNV